MSHNTPVLLRAAWIHLNGKIHSAISDFEYFEKHLHKVFFLLLFIVLIVHLFVAVLTGTFLPTFNQI